MTLAQIRVGGVVRTIDLVVFDKDGTLIDFDHIWVGKAEAAIRATLAAVSAAPALEADLAFSLGVDLAGRRVVPESPMAVASIPALTIVAASVLYRHGHAWHAAETVAARAFRPILSAPPGAAEIRGIGDVAGLWRRLGAAGVRTAVLTTDDRLGTLATLPLLGIEGMAAGIVCGDDAIPTKPEPDGILHLAALAGVDPARVLMIGDSAGDLTAARRAGAGLAVGVLSGTGRAEHLDPLADAVVADIHAIEIETAGGTGA